MTLKVTTEIKDYFNFQTHELKLGEFTVKYLSFIRPTHAHKEPIVILGNTFQGIKSWQYETTQLLKDHPVLLVDLPGTGGNTYVDHLVSKLHCITNQQQGKLLSAFLTKVGVERCILLATSNSARIGYSFAGNYPEKISKLIVSGITPSLRDSVRIILEDSLDLLHKGKMKDFASCYVMQHTNLSKRFDIPMVDKVRYALFEKLKQLRENEKTALKLDIRRVLNTDGLERTPQCPVLVFVGEYDNFTTPFENYRVAEKCPQSTFAIVKGCDHQIALEKKEVFVRLIRRFIKDQPLNRMKDIDLLQREVFPREKIRIEPRWLLNQVGFLDAGNGVFVPINIVDINKFGCRLYTTFRDHRSIRINHKFQLHLPDDDVKMDLILFKQADDGHFRGVFQHRTFESSNLFEGYMEKVENLCQPAYAA